MGSGGRVPTSQKQRVSICQQNSLLGLWDGGRQLVGTEIEESGHPSKTNT